MKANKTELLLGKFEENIELEKFFLDQSDQISLAHILEEQQGLLLALLQEMSLLPNEEPLWLRLRTVAAERSLQEKKVMDSLGEMRRKMGRLRQSAKRLHDWRKAWRSAVMSGSESSDTYA